MERYKAKLVKLVALLKEWKKKRTTPNPYGKSCTRQPKMFPKFYGLPKIHKKKVPLRPIVSSIGSITYEAAKYLTEVIGPLVGKTEHHVKNRIDFVQKIKGLEVHPSQKLVSFDVSAPFTSIPQRKRLGSSGSGWNKTTAGRTELTLMRIK